LEGYAGGMLRRNTVFSFQKFPVYQGLSYPAWETAKSILSPSRLPIPSFRREEQYTTAKSKMQGKPFAFADSAEKSPNLTQIIYFPLTFEAFYI